MSWGFPYENDVYIPIVLINGSRVRRQFFPPSSEAVASRKLYATNVKNPPFLNFRGQ